MVLLKPLISLLLSYANKLCAYMQHIPIFMARTCVYKSTVETQILLTKWINTNHCHKFSNILMKLEGNTEKKYSMQVMLS